jgi:hypothetical protein
MVKNGGKKSVKKGVRDELSRRDRKISSRSKRFSESERDNTPKKKGRPTIRESITDSRGRGHVIVSLRREKQKFSRDARLTLTETEVDPVKMLALLVAGDVVALGLMTEEEYNKAPIYDEDGNIEEPGGRQIAADILGISSRQQAARDLLPYLYSKPQDPAPKISVDDTNKAVIYLPENGRTYNEAAS